MHKYLCMHIVFIREYDYSYRCFHVISKFFFRTVLQHQSIYYHIDMRGIYIHTYLYGCSISNPFDSNFLSKYAFISCSSLVT
jgi:hypothetical protein